MSGDAITRRRGGSESGVAARALLNGRFERISCAQRKPLWSVTIWDKKFNSVATGKQTTAIKYHYLLAGDLKEKIVPGGNVKLLTTSETDWWTTEDKVSGLVSEGEIVSIPWGGNPNVQYFKGRFVTADNRIATSSDKTVLDNKFLYYFMLAKRNTIGSFYRGAGLKHPEMSKVLDMEIPLPNIEAQRSFARCMDNVSKVIAARKMQLDSLSQLVKSRCGEMFGDPEDNPKGFPLLRIDDVVSFHGGSQPDKKFFEYEPTVDNVRLIQIRDYRTDRYKTYIPRSLAKRHCNPDDIMIGRYGPPIFQIFKGLEGAYNVAMMKAVPKMGNREFIRAFLQQDCLRHYLEGFSKRTAGQDGIQMDKLKAYPFPYPPIELQDLFAAFVAKVDKLAFAVRKSLESAEKLYRQQLSEAFA